MKRPLLFGLAVILVVFALGWVVSRLIFLSSAERTVGQVVDVHGRDGRCGGRRSKYNCTRFDADVEFVVDGRPLTLEIDAGRSRGHGQPTSHADVRAGDAVTVVHAPGGMPAYRDTFFAVWGGPLLTFVFGLASAFGGARDKEH